MAYDAISKAIGAASHDPMDGIMAHLNSKFVMRSYVSYIKDDLPRGFHLTHHE
jgi:hypothetical protein